MTPRERGRLDGARAVARERGERAFLAGGAVRDLLLGRPVADLDLALEGDGAAFAKALGRRLGADVRVHERFGTATLELPGGERLDVATTRRERYAASGALPSVESGVSIEEDLGRRDFTIHAMALDLARRPTLIDPFGGRGDLRRRLVRTLHPQSFLDDPTRVFRAVRYAARLDFRLAPATRRALVAAVQGGALGRISADRRRRELRLILEEPERARAIALLRRLGVAAALHSTLSRAGAAARVRRESPSADWLCYLSAWMGTATEPEIDDLVSKLGLSRADSRALRTGVRGVPGDLPVGGADLIAAGVPPGPAIGRALALTRAAIAEERLSPEEALAFAVRAARRGA
ncbi:MAG TPA: hypothetical protein VMN82_07310 [Thermoanaerobaculia bacterium]|nr:hypothetical protein [Thermoanaerobaculia bacterium]